MMFSENLRNLIQVKRLTLTQISKDTDIPISTLSEWTGGREPKVSEKLLKLCRYLETTLDELVLNEKNLHQESSIVQMRFKIENKNYILKIYKPKENKNV